jgi:tryptophan 2,3-dioxygenase
MELKPELLQRIEALQKKYASMGQDILSYLDGLLYADFLTYWDYIHLDTLLSLQNPKTSIPDEKIFIMYHQITELYFKLSLHEFNQIADKKNLTVEFMVTRIKRITRYFEHLTNSFAIMIDGMEQEQFLKFRMSLLPASGFQSAQYRMIEICSTSFINLVAKDKREGFRSGGQPFDAFFEHIYWKAGATELATGNKTLTLKQFEEKYAVPLIELANEYKDKNLWALYKNLPAADQENPELKNALRWLDINVNINWPLVHYKTAARYLQRNPEDIRATGGTNWQKYLPPRLQLRIFYPELWTSEEKENWGKSWVEKEVYGQMS